MSDDPRSSSGTFAFGRPQSGPQTMAEMENVLLKSNRLNPWKNNPDQLASLVTEENDDEDENQIVPDFLKDNRIMTEMTESDKYAYSVHKRSTIQIRQMSEFSEDKITSYYANINSSERSLRPPQGL